MAAGEEERRATGERRPRVLERSHRELQGRDFYDERVGWEYSGAQAGNAGNVQLRVEKFWDQKLFRRETAEDDERLLPPGGDTESS